MKRILLAFIIIALTAVNSFAIQNISGNFKVGVGQTYTSLTNDSASGFFKFLNSIDGTSSVINGAITVTIVSNITNETGAVELHALHYDGSGPYTITIQPDTAIIRTIAGGPGVSGTGLIAFNGAGYVTIDGSYNGAGKYLTFTNSQFYAVYTILGFINGANHITVKNSVLQGSAIGDNVGSINILTSTGPDGNNNLAFDNNDIGNDTYIDTRVYCSGSPSYPNHDIAFTNNNIFNFIDGGNSFYDYGINITATGNGNNFTITGNSFYQTGVCNGSAYHMSAITFLPGSSSTGNRIDSNYIGGNLPQCAAGSLPAPGYWCQNNDNSSMQYSNMVDINCGSVTVSNNVIKNVRIQGLNYSFTLLNIAGSTHATIANNQFGDNNSALRFSIEYSDPDNLVNNNIYLKGIDNASTGTVIAGNNKFLNLWVVGSSDYYAFVEPIVFNAASSNSQIINNTVISCESEGGDYSTTDNNFGINVNAASGTLNNLLISGNTIQIPYAVASNYYDIGIIVQGNASFSGTISNNRVYDHQSSTFSAYGIYIDMTGSGSNTYTVSNNQISLTNSSVSGSIAMYGMADGSCNGTGSSANYFYNSVYIGGTSTSTIGSFGFYNNPCFGSGTGPALNIKNNIFINGRSGGSGVHYAISNNYTGGGWASNASDYNLLVSRRTLGFWYGSGAQTFSQWQTRSAGDANSISAAWNASSSTFAGTPYPGTNTLDPSDLFVSTATGDLHINTNDMQSYKFIYELGTPVSVTVDYDSTTRNVSTPNIGSDEFSITVTGINEPANAFDIMLYPNPATSQLTIYAPAFKSDEAAIISVRNVLGQQILPPASLQMKGEIAAINVSGLPPGVYLIELKSESVSVVKRFMKE